MAGPRTQENARARLRASFQMTRSLKLVAEGYYRQTISTDSRIAYDRNRYSIGIVWEPN